MDESGAPDVVPVVPGPRLRWLRVVVLAVLVAALVATFVYVDPRSLSPVAVRDWVQGFGLWGPLVYLALFVVGTILVLPFTLLIAIGALLFPIAVALPMVWVATLIGSSATFMLARWLGRRFVEERLGAHVRRVDDHLERGGLRAMLVMRLAAFPPSNILNYAAGLTKMRYRDFALGTALGVIPYITVVATVVSRIGSSPRLADVVRDPVLYAALAAVAVVYATGRLLRRGSRAPEGP